MSKPTYYLGIILGAILGNIIGELIYTALTGGAQ